MTTKHSLLIGLEKSKAAQEYRIGGRFLVLKTQLTSPEDQQSPEEVALKIWRRTQSGNTDLSF